MVGRIVELDGAAVTSPCLEPPYGVDKRGAREVIDLLKVDGASDKAAKESDSAFGLRLATPETNVDRAEQIRSGGFERSLERIQTRRRKITHELLLQRRTISLSRNTTVYDALDRSSVAGHPVLRT